MLATLLGPPELEAAGPVDVPPQAASIVATTTTTIGNRFMFSLPKGLRKPELKTLREL
jgi:hypothetical protein